MAIQSPYSQIATLVIDDMQTQQTTLRGQLQMLHIQKVDVATTAEDAIRMVKAKPYGLILCDFNLNQKSDGQQLLEYLRESGLLSPDCLFFMVTAENSYSAVASASEYKPDAYLLKPITAGDVEDRLKALLDRRNALQPINQRLARQDLNGALAECNVLLAKKDRWTMQALQVKGQTLLQMGRHEEARDVYTQVLALRPTLIWAQLGMAKAHRAAGKFEDAKFIAKSIIASKDGEKNVEAYDLVAQCLEAQGDMQGALWVMKDSAVVMPSAKRQRMVAESAYRNDDLETANECFARLAKATRGSVTSQPQDTLAHAQALVDVDDPKAAIALLDAGQTQHKNDAQFTNVALAIRAQALAKAGDAAGAKDTVTKARATMRRAKADFATVALAKAELLTGNEEAGLKLLETAVSSDHENPRVKQLIGNALRRSGLEDKMQQIVDGAVGEINARVTSAKAQFRDSRIDEALASIETALKDFPDNTGVLLQAAQMNCMALRLKKQLNAAIAERVRLYLSRLDTLMPGSDRVSQMHRYYRETVAALSATPATQAA